MTCLVSDQLTKWIAIQELYGKPMQTYWGDTFRLEYSENPGAFLSLFAGLSEEWRFWILTAGVAVFLAVVFFYLITQRKLGKMSVAALSLLAGGGLSNLLDRIFRANHRVVDFMNMGIGSLRTGIFNVADMAIMLAVGLLLWETVTQGGQASSGSRDCRETRKKQSSSC